MSLEEISPERFILELYNPAGLWSLDEALYAAVEFGYCDAARLFVRPRIGLYALMVTWANGSKSWFHINPRLLTIIRKRLAKRV